MKRIINCMMAATIACGVSMFSSCSSDKDDDVVQEQSSKNRTEFIEHTRGVMKSLTENMNFTSWEAANTLNLYFNEYVLNNEDFNQAVLVAFMQKVIGSIQSVEENSELATMGYTMYGTVDFCEFNYRFTMNSENTGFDMEEADDFEVVINGWNALTQQFENGIYKLSIKAGGTQSFKFIHAINQMDNFAVVFIMPSELQFAISDKTSGTWKECFTGTFQNQVSVAAGHEYAELARDTWGVSGSVSSNFPTVSGLNDMSDQSTLTFSIVNNREDYTGEYSFGWEQNGQKMIDLFLKQSRDADGGLANLDMTQFTSTSSILDVLTAWSSTRSLDEAQLTLLDDLTTTISISDIAKSLELAHASASARRDYADEATIDQYTQQLNEVIKAEMTCKGINQTIPMKLVTTKFGVDYWTMPAFSFSDGNGYVSLIDLLDTQSVAYAINIVDHAAEPMQQSMIIVRQLIQYMQGLSGGFQPTQSE